MTNVTGIDLNPILQRLNSTNNYHPFDAETFSDWATEAGDIVTISRNGETYVSPVHTSRMVWKGKAPTMQISTTGNEKRDAVSRVSRKKYGRGSAGVRSQEGIHRNFVSEDGILHSELHITESYLRTEFHDETNSLRSEFDMTASHMRTEFLDQVHSLRSEFEVTASHLRTEFEDDVNSLRGEFEVTASHLRTEFEDDINSLRGEFEVTASHLRTEFDDGIHSLRGEFEVTASGLRTEFEDDVNSVRSYVHQTASSWEARVAPVSDANGNVTPASIALAINSAGSEARINADRIYLLGQTIADTVDANYISTKVAEIPHLYTNHITMDGDLTLGGRLVLLGVNVTSLVSSVKSVRISGPTNNTYKLQYTTYDDDSWQDAGTFSRATTLSGAWSGRRFTVTASPQGNEIYTDLWSAVPAANVTWDGTIATLSLYATINGGETTYNAGTVTTNIASFLQDKTGATKKFTANGLYSADSGYVGFGNIEIDVPQSTVEPTTLSIQWNGSRRLNANANPQGVSRYTTIVSSIPNSDITFSGTTLTLPLKATYDGGEETVAVGSVTANISGKLQTKTISENGTVNPDAGYIGFGSVTVAVPVTNAGARFNAAEGSYFVEAYDKTSGTSIADSSTGYKLGLSGTKVQIQNASGTKIGSTPEYTIPLETKTISSNGTVNPSSGKVGFSSVTVAVPSDLPNARTRFGASSGSYYVEAYDSSSSGGTSIAGSSVTYKLGFSGKTVQIQNASGSQLSSTPTLTLGISNGTLSSGSRTLTVTAGGSNTTATTTITDYKDGWAAYYTALKWPEVPSTLSATFSVKRPSNTVDSPSDREIRNYVISSKNNNTVYLRYDNQTYAEFPHGKYDLGWGDARGKCSVPSSTSTSGTMTVTIPPATVGGNAVPYYYAPAVDKKYAYIKQGTTTVARISHTIHNDAGNTAFVAYVTGASVPSGTTPTELSYDTNYKFYARYTNADNSAADATGSSYSVRYFKTKPDRYNTGYDTGYSKGVDDYYGDYIVPVFSERYQDNYNGNQYKTNGGTFIRKIHAGANTGIHIPLSEDGANAGSANLTEIPSGGITANGNYKFRSGYAGIRYLSVNVPGSSHSISVSKQWTFGGSGYDTGGKLRGGAFSKSGLSARTYYYITVSCGGTSKQIYFVCND